VGVRDDDCIGAIEWKLLIAGKSIYPFFFRMHPGIEQNQSPIQIERIGVSTDFGSEIQGLE